MIAVLDYGIGNLRSAEKALQYVGADARLVTSAAEAAAAEAVVLPGVGAFGACMQALRVTGLDGVALDAAGSGKPFLGICVGMQLLYEGSEESPGVSGLGILAGLIRRLPDGLRRPQMQWNRMYWDASSPTHPLLAGLGPEPWVYFVHSYAAPVGPETVAWCDYGGRVPAVVGQGSVWATQFHPEKSSATGLALLGNFARAASATAQPGA